MKIIGIAGTDASGKDSVARILVGHGWLYISISDILRGELANRGVLLMRQNLRKLSAEWRRELGLGVLVNKAVEEFRAKSDVTKYKGLVIASLRNPGEASRVHELGGVVIWTDAKPAVRYARILARQRGKEDEVTFEEFLAEEKAQMIPSGDEATLNLAAVKEKADIFIENNGYDIEVFKDQVEQALKKVYSL